MTATVQTLLFMLAVLAAVAVVAKRLNIAPSILLVVAGIGVAFVPGLPKVELAPEVVLLVILPPLIYSAGVAMSWREFKFNLRPIALLAFGCVLFTTCAIAAAAHYFLKFDWAVGFLLGAIISPTDVVAPLAIARKLGLPRRIVVVLEGEGLANDATALVLYRFAIVAISTGTFSLERASETFVLIVIGETLYGLAIGWLSLHLRKWAREPRVEITLSLMTPYLAFWVPSYLWRIRRVGDGRFAFNVSWNGPLLIPSGTRLQGIFFWDLIVYLIEGLVFLVTGLQTRTLIEQTHAFSIRELIVATAWTTLIAIAARFLWVFPAIYIPRWVSARLRKRDPSPPWQAPFFLAFTGMRGVNSLAVALAIPFHDPQRRTISAPRPDFVRHLRRHHLYAGRPRHDAALRGEMARIKPPRQKKHKDEIKAELRARKAALKQVERRLEKAIKDRDLPADAIAHLRTRHQSREQILPTNLTEGLDHIRQTAKVKAELIDAEREFIYQLLRDGKITDEARRRIEYELDLEEASVANRGQDGGGWM